MLSTANSNSNSKQDRVKIHPWQQGAEYRALATNHGTPLMVFDPQQLQKNYRALGHALPGVKLFFAVKSQPETAVLESLAAMGSHFEVASSGEIERLRPLQLSPRKVIHSHPIKHNSEIIAALRYGCTSFVIDNAWELEKFVAYRHRVGLLLRISFENKNAKVDLSRKFGCSLEQAPLILQKAAKLGLHVKGLSFHVGSQCLDGTRHGQAINACAGLIKQQQNDFGRRLSVLDIGGGFPVPYFDDILGFDNDLDFENRPDSENQEKDKTSDQPDINAFCQPIRQALEQLPDHTKIWAEPGRFLVASTVISISSIIGKAMRHNSHWYFLDDGLYGSFSGQLYDHALYPLAIYSDNRERGSAVIAGPTCDSIDVIAEQCQLPSLDIGDLLVGFQMGAYTNASASNFNSLAKVQFIVKPNSDILSNTQTNHLIENFLEKPEINNAP